MHCSIVSRPPVREPAVPDHGQRADRHVHVAELHGEVERACDVRHRPRVSSTPWRAHDPAGASRGARPPPLWRCCDSAVRPGHQRISRQPAERLALLQPLAERRAGSRAPPARPRSPRRCRRSGSTRATADGAGPRAPTAADRAPNRRARAYCAAASRWAPSGRGARGGGRRVAEHRVHVAGRLGVVGEPREVQARRPAARPARRAPTGAARASAAARSTPRPRAGRARAGTRLPRRRTRSMPGGEALVEARPIDSPGDRLEQPELGLRRDDRDRLEQRPPRGAQPSRPREHGVADRVGDRVGAGRERLDDEERIACGLGVELVRRRRRTARPARRPQTARGRCSFIRLIEALVASSPSTIRSGWAASSSVVAVADDDERRAPSRRGGRAAGRRRASPRPPSARPRARRRSGPRPLSSSTSAADDLVRHRAALDERGELAPERLRDLEAAARADAA